MRIGFAGLGKMGGNMVRRLLRGGHEVAAHDPDERARAAVAAEGAAVAGSLEELVGMLQPPRAVWVMVPAGAVTEKVLASLAGLLDPGDVAIDGGNSWYKDTVRRAGGLGERGIALLDAGTSGGVWGLAEGYCLMVGGEPAAFARVEPALATLAPEGGYARVGPSGAGHFAKMVHNGIEYALMQSYAEGFEILAAKGEYPFDLEALARLWNRGSVIRSWLLELAGRAFGQDPRLEGVRGWVADTGEGRWTVLEAIERDVPAPAITLALQARLRSRQDDSFAAKFTAALRDQFGGHGVRKAEGG